MRSGINHMCILRNSKDLLDNNKSRSFSQVSSIKTFDFSTLYTTLPHGKLKTRLKETIHKAFSHWNYGSNIFATIPHIIKTNFKKVKHATPRNKWSVCWSSSSITYLSPLERHCFSRSSAYQWVRISLLLHMVFTSCNWFAVQGPVTIILISWNVIFIWETGYWTRAIQRFAFFDLLKSLYSDTKILSKCIPSLQKRL